MRKITTLFCICLILISCNSAKRNQKLLAQGNYDQAIELAIRKLQRTENNKKRAERITLLENAFQKMKAQDNRRIDFLKKQNNVSAIREIYYTYQNMDYIQNKIRPLLPLYNENTGRDAVFRFENYSSLIVDARKKYLAAVYDEAGQYYDRQTIEDYRTAYNIYCDIEELQSNYKDVAQLKDNARFYGTDFVYVTLNNRSGQIIPLRLEQELLNFNTYGLDDFWTQYHNKRNGDIEYNYGIALNFKEILISPERLHTTEEVRKKRVKDGWEYVLDANGNVAKDSLGNDIKRDKYINVTARVQYTEQEKAVAVGGDVLYRDIINRRDLNRYPLATEFVFENIFATFVGDKRALTKRDYRYLKNEFIPFPSNEQMVFDAGEDIKARLKNILVNNKIR